MGQIVSCRSDDPTKFNDHVQVAVISSLLWGIFIRPAVFCVASEPHIQWQRRLVRVPYICRSVCMATHWVGLFIIYVIITSKLLYSLF